MSAWKLPWLGSVVVAVLVVAGPLAAEDQVVKLRTARVTLYDQPNGKAVQEFPRDRFTQPWPIRDRSPEGFLQVEVDGRRYWVRPYAVETSRPVRANAECGAVVAGAQPKSGATRAIGEECKDSKR